MKRYRYMIIIQVHLNMREESCKNLNTMMRSFFLHILHVISTEIYTCVGQTPYACTNQRNDAAKLISIYIHTREATSKDITCTTNLFKRLDYVQ